MSEFIVHSIPGSPFGRAVLATLEEKAAGYRLAPVGPGTLKAEPHISRHPFGRVPVLEHGGFMLYESQAILRYLDRILPAPPLTPADPEAAARMDQAMNVNDWYLFQGVNNVIGFHRVVGPRVLGLTPDEAAIAAAMPKAHVVFNELARLLGEQAYFASGAVSLADMLIAPQLDFLAATPEWSALTAEAPNLVAWLDRMNARSSLKATTWEHVSEMAKAA
jgi:glutathione S-transferase